MIPACRRACCQRTLQPSGFDLRRAAAGIDGRTPVGPVETMDARLGKMLGYPRFRVALLSALAVLAVLLASIGLYGVLGQCVVQRTPGIGVRIWSAAGRLERCFRRVAPLESTR